MRPRTIGICVVVLVVIALGWLLIPRGSADSGQDGSSAAPSPTSTANPSSNVESAVPTQEPSPVDPASACPTPERLSNEPYDAGREYAIDSDYMMDRVFDYVEASVIQDPQKLLVTLRDSGTPKGLLTRETQAELEQQVKNADPDMEIPGDDLTYVLDRRRTVDNYDPDEEQSTDDMRRIYVIPIFTTCRNGIVENRELIPSITPMETTWTLQGAWRLLAGDLV